MVVCGAVKHAVKAEQAGCDAVICQGGEGGGHTGLVGTLPLVAQAVEAVKIPVVAAGGLYDGRGLAAALSLGAVGVWMGTRFIASQEAHAGQMYRDTIVEATDEDTVRTRSYSRQADAGEEEPLCRRLGKPAAATSSPSRSRPCVAPAPASWAASAARSRASTRTSSCFAMGQSAGGVREVLPAAEIVAPPDGRGARPPSTD